MNFRPVKLVYGGVEGVIPAGWTDAGDGRFTRMDSEGDPTMLFEKSFPHVSVQELKAFLAPFLGVDEFPAPIRRLEAGVFTWELYTFEQPLPYLGRVVSDFAFVQDRSWVYMVALSTRPGEHEELYKEVFTPVITAFRPLNHSFGHLTGDGSNPDQGLSTAQQLGYDADQVLVIVHADDVGCHAAHTDGALAAMRIGIHQVMTHIALMTDDFADKVPGAHFRYVDYRIGPVRKPKPLLTI
jgi:hypothetical protein